MRKNRHPLVLNTQASTERLQHDAAVIFGRLYVEGFALGAIHRKIVRHFENHSVEPPEDVFAFATEGMLSDRMFHDWSSRLEL